MKYLIKIVALAGVVAIIRMAVFAPPRCRFSAKASALAIRGHNVFQILKESRFNEGADDALKYATAEELLCEVIKGNQNAQHSVADDIGCLWSYVIQPEGLLSNSFPLLVSANLNPSELNKRNGNVSLGPSTGANRSLLMDQAIVIVLRDGSVTVIRQEDVNIESVIGRDNIANTSVVDFLTHKGVCRVPIDCKALTGESEDLPSPSIERSCFK